MSKKDVKKKLLQERSKLQELAEYYGYDSPEELMLGECNPFKAYPGIPAICMNEGCSYVAEYEPDQTEGWCEVCEDNSVKSSMVMFGMI